MATHTIYGCVLPDGTIEFVDDAIGCEEATITACVIDDPADDNYRKVKVMHSGCQDDVYACVDESTGKFVAEIPNECCDDSYPTVPGSCCGFNSRRYGGACQTVPAYLAVTVSGVKNCCRIRLPLKYCEDENDTFACREVEGYPTCDEAASYNGTYIVPRASDVAVDPHDWEWTDCVWAMSLGDECRCASSYGDYVFYPGIQIQLQAYDSGRYPYEERDPHLRVYVGNLYSDPMAGFVSIGASFMQAVWADEGGPDDGCYLCDEYLPETLANKRTLVGEGSWDNYNCYRNYGLYQLLPDAYGYGGEATVEVYAP